jgi:drug/metabolite transporter (DMT)-like permease
MLFDPYSLLPPLGWLAASVLCIASWNLLIRAIMKNEKDFLAVAVAGDTISTAAILVLAAFSGYDFTRVFASASAQSLIFLACAMGLYSAWLYLTYKASQQVEASERALLGQIQVVWALLLAFIIAGEAISAERMLAIGLILAGSFICLYERKKTHFMHAKSGYAAIIICAFILGTTNLLDKINLQAFDVLFYTFLLYAVPMAVIGLIMGRSAPARAIAAVSRNRILIPALSIASIMSFGFAMLSLSKIDISLYTPLISLNVVLTAIGGILILGEKEGWAQKIAGAALAFAGAFLIS